ncbi:MAG: ABC transporter ATP-binding protein/permease [Clostridiales bacterium]|jgi:ATP-binding cassette subfamily B protein|nr:ABC transporter ATP-binding protein/permease [Clostridiales bacterium]
MKSIILEYFKKSGLRYFIGLAMVFASTYFAASIPGLLGQAIDVLKEGRAGSELTRAAFNIGLAAFLAFSIRFIWRFLVLGFCRGIETYCRIRLFAHLESLSTDFYLKYNTGDIITRAISDVLALRRMFGIGIVMALDALTMFIASAINMAGAAGFGMMLIAAVPAPFLIFFISLIRKSLRKRQYKIREAASDLASKVQENLGGIRVIKTYAQEYSEAENVSELSKNLWKAEMRMVRLSASISPIIKTAFALVFSAFIIMGSQMVGAGSITIGDFTAFNGYILLMINPVAMIGRVIEVWQMGLSSMQRLDELFRRKPSVNDAYAEEGANVTDGRIEVKNLSFAYPVLDESTDKRYEKVLNNISFTINPGETLAITGPVGSGKTTLASLLLRLWPISQGMISVDGQDINSIPVKNLRTAVGYVPQDNFLFSDSIISNIRFHSPDVTDDDVYAAAKAVSIHDNIMDFPLKYDTVVGERGMTLSGGQKQRVSIARALVRKPKILLLDDCLSAVDAETEHAIISGLRQYMSGITGIIITHRVAAAQLADRIMVLSDKGMVAEIGTYQELMELRGEFYNLVLLQTGEN